MSLAKLLLTCHSVYVRVCVAVRGLARFPDGLQQLLPLNTIRQMYGAGVRAGMYPLTEQDAYWYICFNAPEVSAGAQAVGPGKCHCILCGPQAVRSCCLQVSTPCAISHSHMQILNTAPHA